ncbi:MAG TPA: hypothetical protein PLG15_04450 [Candidatus Gastranaerophilaceae bacterium]|nr:hypothetical protein [Candidatus Gastranaerophilaceae bacterium]HPT41617.1 hypothetical protein [Candidatus Gastranaerophilaceae bacterium]
MSNSVNTSNYGQFGLTWGSMGQGFRAFGENIGARVSEALEKPNEELNNFFDQVEFVQSEDYEKLREYYNIAAFNTTMAMNRENLMTNGKTPKLSIKG